MNDLKHKIELLESDLASEITARKIAEELLEKKSNELSILSQAYKSSNNRLEELLKEKSSELEGVFVNIIDAYVIMDLRGNVLKMNNAATKLLGFDINNDKINLTKLIHREYLGYTKLSINQLLANGSIQNYRIVIKGSDKKEKIVNINASLIYDKEGKPIAAQGIARDITEEFNLKNQLEKQKRQLDSIFKNSPIGIALMNLKNRKVIMVNEAICKMLGYSEEEFKEMNIRDIFHPDDEETTNKFRDELFEDKLETSMLEKRYFAKSGEIIWTKTSVAPIKDTDNSLERLVLTIEDITREKQIKES